MIAKDSVKFDQKEYDRRYYIVHLERRKETNSKYYTKHKKEINERRRKRYKENPKRCKEINRKSDLVKIGWTPEMYELSLLEQGNRCAICRLPMSKACADHKHVTPPEPRGILCINCNTAIGSFKENPEIIRAAAD